MCTPIHKRHKPRFLFFFRRTNRGFWKRFRHNGRAKILGHNGCSMAPSIAHTMMGLGLGKNGCVLWIKGKTPPHFLGVIDDLNNLMIQDRICQGRMVHNYSSVMQHDRPSTVGASADCSGMMTLICSLFSSPCCCSQAKQALFVGKKDWDSFSCSVSMEVPTTSSNWDESPQVNATPLTSHFVALECCPEIANRTSGVIQILLSDIFLDSGDSTERRCWGATVPSSKWQWNIPIFRTFIFKWYIFHW